MSSNLDDIQDYASLVNAVFTRALTKAKSKTGFLPFPVVVSVPLSSSDTTTPECTVFTTRPTSYTKGQLFLDMDASSPTYRVFLVSCDPGPDGFLSPLVALNQVANPLLALASNPYQGFGVKASGAVALSSDATRAVRGASLQSNRVVLFGDSMTNQNNYTIFGASGIGGLSRTSGVATLTITSHGMPTGKRIRIGDVPEAGFNGDYRVTRVDANTVTFVCPGPDATATRNGAWVMDLTWLTGFGYFIYANQELGGSMVLVRNSGDNSDTTATLLARVKSDVIDLDPSRSFVLCGYNDYAQGVPVATAIANVLEIYSRLIAAGIITTCVTMLPLGSGNALFAGSNAWVTAFNAAIRKFVASNRGARLGDAWAAFVDRYNTTNIGCAKTGLLGDEIHPSQKGGRVLGRVIAAANNDLPRIDFLPSSTADISTSAGGRNVVIAQPTVSSGGTLTAPASGSLTGTAAGSITISGSGTASGSGAVASVPVRSDGTIAQRLVITPAAAEAWTIRSNAGSTEKDRLTAGEIRRLVADLRITGIPGSTFKGAVLHYSYTVDGVTYYHYLGSTTSVSFVDLDMSGPVISEPYETPAGTITNCGWRLDIYFSGAGSAVTVEIGQVGYLLEPTVSDY